ncbi:MAG: hypothetical protein MI974_00480 [Chitinophagales bacterium]|nr:hypothetical protein [Chitinophagales bacterium]
MTILLILFSANLIGIYIYIYYAQHKSLLDSPNERSSHKRPTVRGGGLFLAPTFLFSLLHFFPSHYLSVFAILLIAIVSFVDDLRNLSYRIRLPLQLLSSLLLIFDSQPSWSIGAILLALILITGWVNTFNFMDGINGNIVISGSVMLASFGWLHLDNDSMWEALEPYMIMAIFAFAIFNFRKKALCFAGDVGSVSLAMILAWFFLMHWQGLNSLYLLLLPAIFAVDSVMTIILRLFRRENIFQPHRTHLYQLLANERGWDHRVVAILYGVIQIGINLIAFKVVSGASSRIQFFFITGIYVFLSLIYFLCRKLILGSNKMVV